VDKLIGGPSGNGYYTLGYADDIAILMCRKLPNTVSENNLYQQMHVCTIVQLSKNAQ
jgi:hypothetical protein